MPALATSTSTGPCFASAWANAPSTEAASRTSQVTTVSPSTSAPEREVTVTASPPAASLRAIARPIPRFPPVTRTDRLMGNGTSERTFSYNGSWRAYRGGPADAEPGGAAPWRRQSRIDRLRARGRRANVDRLRARGGSANRIPCRDLQRGPAGRPDRPGVHRVSAARHGGRRPAARRRARRPARGLPRGTHQEPAHPAVGWQPGDPV